MDSRMPPARQQLRSGAVLSHACTRSVCCSPQVGAALSRERAATAALQLRKFAPARGRHTTALAYAPHQAVLAVTQQRLASALSRRLRCRAVGVPSGSSEDARGEDIKADDAEDNGVANNGTTSEPQAVAPALGVDQALLVEEFEPPESKRLRKKGLFSMYSMYALACLLERTWRFAQPFLLTQLGGGIATVVQLQFLGQLAAVLSIPLVGTRLDSVDRVVLLRLSTVVQNVTIAASAALIAVAFHFQVRIDLSAGIGTLPTQLFMLLAGLTMAEKLTALAFDVSVERDWVVALTGLHRHADLAETNSMLRRIDQMCEAIGCAIFGSLFVAMQGASFAAVMLLALAITPIQQHCHSISISCHEKSQALLGFAAAPVRAAVADLSGGASTRAAGSQPRVALSVQLMALPAKMLRTLLALPILGIRNTVAAARTLQGLIVLPVSLSFTVCFFNVALGPGAIMTAFLAEQGGSAQAIAFIRSAGGLMAFAAMLVATKLVAALGVLDAGLAACAFHAGGVLLAGMMYWAFFASAAPGGILAAGQALAEQALPWVHSVGPMGTVYGLWVFSALVNSARAGVWVFEIIETQIFQTATPSKVMVTASAAEAAVQSMAELSLLGIAAIGLGGYDALVVISQLAALASLLIYVWWLLVASGRANYSQSLQQQLAAA